MADEAAQSDTGQGVNFAWGDTSEQPAAAAPQQPPPASEPNVQFSWGDEQQPTAQQTQQPEQPPGFGEQVLRSAESYGVRHPMFGIPFGMAESLAGRQSRVSAFGSGVMQGATGNLSDTVKEHGAGAMKDLFGVGRSQEEQKAADNQFNEAIQQKYQPESVGGKLAGLLGLGFYAAPAAPEALANSTAGRIAWQSLIGGGQGAFLGFASGHGFQERMHEAATSGLIGGALGAAGGVLTEGVNGVLNKLMGPTPTAEEAQAIKQAGLQTGVPVKMQQEGIEEALQKTVPVQEAEGMPEAVHGVNQDIQQAVASHAKQMQDTAKETLRQAGSYGASVSADAVGGVSQDIMRSLARDGVDLTKNVDPYSSGARALNVLKDVGERAAKSPNGRISLMDLEDAHQSINKFYAPNDYVYSAVRHGFDKWLGDAVDSHLMSGEPAALDELLKWRSQYSDYKQFIDPKTALGSIFRKGQSGDMVANWFSNVTRLGDGEKAAVLAGDLKGVLGETSPEWSALRSLTWSKMVVGPRTGELRPQILANNIDKLLTSPVSRQLYTPDEVAGFYTMAKAFRALPPESPFLRHLSEIAEKGAIFGTMLGGYEGYREGAEEGDRIKGMLRGAMYGAAAYGAIKGMPHLAPVARHAAGLLGRSVAPLGVSAYQTFKPSFHQAQGGAVQRAINVSRRPS